MPNANRIWSQAPTIRCPMCDHQWQMAASFQGVGHNIKCPKCGRMLECVDVIRTWEWQCIEPDEGGELTTGPINDAGDFSIAYSEHLKDDDDG